MEGPYMSGFGSNQKYIRWNGAIERSEYENLIKAMKGYAKIWAIDPIREGIEGFMADVKAEDENAIFALGHSRAPASARNPSTIITTAQVSMSGKKTTSLI